MEVKKIEIAEKSTSTLQSSLPTSGAIQKNVLVFHKETIDLKGFNAEQCEKGFSDAKVIKLKNNQHRRNHNRNDSLAASQSQATYKTDMGESK